MIKVGVILPFSGGVELYGEQARVGLDLAAHEINAGGGILGQPLELLYRDDTTRSPELAARLARSLIEEDGVVAVVGPFTSANLNAVLPVCESLRVPLLYATNYEGGKTERHFFSFSTVPHQELQPLLESMGEGKVFMLGADRPWPHSMFAVAARLLGDRVVGTAYTLGTESDFTPLIRQVAASGADILLYALKGDGAHFLPQARAQGLKVAVAYLGLSEVDREVFMDDMLAVVPFLASSSPEFVGRVQAHAGPVIVSHYVMTHYLALMALKAALEKGGPLVEALEGLTLEGPTGRVTMGRDHHVSHSLFLARTRGQDLILERALGELA